MSVTLKVTRGFTATAGVPISTADLNAGFLPAVELEGDVLEPGASGDELKPAATFMAASTGSSGAYVLTLNPAPDSLVNGLWCGFIANHANTGAATLDVNGLSPAAAIVTQAGLALTGGEIVSGQPVFVQWYAASSHWRMWSNPSKQDILYSADSGATNAYVATLPMLEISALSQITGLPFFFKATSGNTGASTLKLKVGAAATELGPIAIKKQGTTALSSGDIIAGGMVGVTYDGTYFQMTSYAGSPALPSVLTAQTVTRPYSLTFDVNGRCTAISEHNMYDSGLLAVPDASGTTVKDHGLGRAPDFVRVTFVMSSAATLDYVENDEVDISALTTYSSGTSYAMPAFFVVTNATQIIVVRQYGSLIGKRTGLAATETFVPADWKMRIRAW